MSTLGLIDFTDVEKEVMMFIARNPGKLCTIQSIFNDIIEDRNISSPEIRNDLKVKLHIVMSQLNSKQSNVTVVKRGDNYLVGYNMDTSIPVSDLLTTNSDVTNDSATRIDTSGLAKSMFEYIVDNDINYSIGPDCNGDNLLSIGISLGDYERVKKLKSKHKISFFDTNANNKSLLDLYPANFFVHQQCSQELNQEIVGLKKREVELLNNIVKLNNELIELENQVTKLRKNQAQRNLYDIYMVLLVFVAVWWSKFL